MQYHPSDQQAPQCPSPHQNPSSQLYLPSYQCSTYSPYPPYPYQPYPPYPYQPYPPYPPPQTYSPYNAYPPYPPYPLPQPYPSPFPPYSPYPPYPPPQPYPPYPSYQSPQPYSPYKADFSYKSLSSDNRKTWFLHPTNEDTNNHSKIRDLQNSKDFPSVIFDDNYIYKLDFYRGDTGYYYCMNKNIKNIKCSARRIYKNGELEMPSKRENFFHESDACKIQNLVASEQIKNQLYILRLNVRNFYLKNRQMTARDIHYEFKKCHFSCTISQIEYWLKDLIIYSNGKYSHLKFMKDDLNPNVSRLWCRLNDEVNNIMLFMTDLHEDILIDSNVWLIDGTFRTSPRNFNQVLNIMAVNTLKKKYITVAHILLCGKFSHFCIENEALKFVSSLKHEQTAINVFINFFIPTLSLK